MDATPVFARLIGLRRRRRLTRRSRDCDESAAIVVNRLSASSRAVGTLDARSEQRGAEICRGITPAPGFAPLAQRSESRGRQEGNRYLRSIRSSPA